MRYVLLICIAAVMFAAAAERPKIGLVLSGGGARGGAHLGVIRVLEEHRIPIDGIVGTSMGAFVGGLYASGLSVRRIQRLLTKTDWNRYLTIDYNRDNMPFRRKALQRDFPGDMHLGIDANNSFSLTSGLFKQQYMLQFLKSLTFPVSDRKDFDHLPIPFRAVATNLDNGDTVVLSKGSLAKSIYASLAIPGAFEPIVIDGKTLVDGGISDNLPLDVMRNEMQMDIIIVVDISTPFTKNKDYGNILDVIGQLTDIMSRRNVESTLATLHSNEILITPDLKGFSPLDSDAFAPIIKRGDAAAEAAYAKRLSPLSVSDDAYSRYRTRLASVRRIDECPVIDKIKIDNTTWLNDAVIRDRLQVHPGEQPRFTQIQRNVESIYDMMIFDEVDCRYQDVNGSHVMTITATPSRDVNGRLKFAFGFEDDFNGHSDYSVKAEYLMFGLNSYGGEWRSRFSIGIEKLIYTELYQPLDPLQRFYIRPRLFYRDKKVYVTPSIFASHETHADLDQSLPIRARETGAAFGLGGIIGNSVGLEAGATLKEVNPSVDRFVKDGNGSYFETTSARQSLVSYYFDFDVDTFDNPFFPSRGYVVSASLKRTHTIKNGDTDYSSFFGALTGVYSRDRHSLLFKIKGGKSFNTKNFDEGQDFNAFYTLGGLFNLSGLPTNAVTGDEMLFGALIYRYRITKKGFFGNLSFPLYAGASMEMGDAWYAHYTGNDALKENILKAGSVYLAADTLLGPFYFAWGMTEGGYHTLYLSLGKSF